MQVLATIAEWFVALLLIVVALSHIVAPALWAGLFRDLIKQPYGGLVAGYLALLIGLPVLLVHPRWTLTPGVIATLLGWGATIKGTLYLLFPRLAARVAGPHVERPSHFVVGGVIGLVLGGVLLAWCMYWAWPVEVVPGGG